MDDKKSEAEERLIAIRWKRMQERGERLKEERKRLGLSLVAFSNLLGIHRNTQVNYEAGREPPASYLLAAQEAGVDIAYVMDGERLEGMARHCACILETIIERARDQGLCDLNPDALAELAFLVAKDQQRTSSGLGGEMEKVQVDALIEAAFRSPDEFFEAAVAIGKYGSLATGEVPAPTDEAGMVLDTLSVYAEHRGDLHLSLRDNIRLVAEGVVRSKPGVPPAQEG